MLHGRQALRLLRRSRRQGAVPRGARRRRVRADRRGRSEPRCDPGRGLPRLLRGAGHPGRRPPLAGEAARAHRQAGPLPGPVALPRRSRAGRQRLRRRGDRQLRADQAADRRARAAGLGVRVRPDAAAVRAARVDPRADLADADLPRPAEHRTGRGARRAGAGVPRPRAHRGRHRRLAAPAGDRLRRRPGRVPGRALHRRRVPLRLGRRHAGPDQGPGRPAADRRARRDRPRPRGGRRRDRADPRLPAHHAAHRRGGAPARRHAEGGVRRHPRGAGPPVRRLADLRALPALRRVPDLGRVLRRRAPGDLDSRARPRRVGRAAGMSHPVTDAPPVLVLGCGPVGQTTALLLARWGLPVVVLDGRPERDLIGSKAICQQRDVLDVWDAVGVGAEIARRGVTWTTARTFHRDAELFSFTFADRGRSPFPPFVNISQCETEALLDERIAAEDRIDVRWGHEVTGVEQDDSGVTVTCANGTSVRGSYAVACPGPRSDELRSALGLTFEGETFDDHFLICDIRTDLPGWETERRFYFDPEWNPGRQVLIHPCPDSTFRIDWQVPPEFDLAAQEASGGLDRRIRQVIGDRPYEVVWKSVYRFHSRVVDRMRVGRVLVAGDAAHLVSPFGARGLNSGVLDAENAAWKIAFVLRGWAPESLLDSYHDERHAAALENIEVTGATMRFLVPGSEADPRRRLDVLERPATDAQARAQVDSGRLAEPFWYVDSPLTTPDPTRPFPGRPARGDVPVPAPGVLVPDCPVIVPDRPDLVRLRQLAREGVTVLLGDDAPLPHGLPADLPVAVHRIADLDPTPVLGEALGARPDEIWVLRPDAHVAAVLPRAADVTPAVARLLARAVPVPA